MIDTVLNLLFRCPHRRLTRPVTPVSKGGVPQGDTYVVCLECGKQFHYDVKEMRMGKAIERSPETGVLHPAMPMARKKKLQYALWASVPLAIAAGALIKRKRPAAAAKPAEREPGKS